MFMITYNWEAMILDVLLYQVESHLSHPRLVSSYVLRTVFLQPTNSHTFKIERGYRGVFHIRKIQSHGIITKDILRMLWDR